MRELLMTVRDRCPSAVCSQGGTIPDLLASLGAARDLAVSDEPQLDKRAYWVLYMDAASDSERVVGIEGGQPLP